MVVFGSIFADNRWKECFAESREEFEDGLNLLLPITCGRGDRFVTIPSHRVDAFFNAIGRSICVESSAVITRFFERFFDPELGEVHRQRAQMKNHFMLDPSDAELMLRQALWHCEFIYNEAETADRLRNRRVELVFPFFIPEWQEFVGVLRTALVGTDLLFDLYDDGRLDVAAISIVSDIGLVDSRVACRHFLAYLGP